MKITSNRIATRLAALLRDARLRQGIPLRELARRAGTSHATLSAYEQGRKIPSMETFVRIIEACGYSVDFELSRRVRHADGLDRGEELAQALHLAAQFPARHDKAIPAPAFPAHG